MPVWGQSSVEETKKCATARLRVWVITAPAGEFDLARVLFFLSTLYYCADKLFTSKSSFESFFPRKIKYFISSILFIGTWGIWFSTKWALLSVELDYLVSSNPPSYIVKLYLIINIHKNWGKITYLHVQFSTRKILKSSIPEMYLFLYCLYRFSASNFRIENMDE